jgi:hypothetical protein
VARRPIARQLYNNHCEVTAPQTSILPGHKLNSNRGTVISVRSVPRCYKQDKLGVSQSFSEESTSEVVQWVHKQSRCELLLLETGSFGQGQFGNPEEGERLLLKPLSHNDWWRHSRLRRPKYVFWWTVKCVN